jgi:hypothetical protein
MSSLVEAGFGAFYAGAHHEFTALADRDGTIEQDLAFPHRRVRLRFAGEQLADALLPALARRRQPPTGHPDITINLWEATATPHAPIPYPWTPAQIGPGGLINGSATTPILAIHDTASGAITLHHRPQHTILHRVPNHHTIPWWERAAPLRPALHLALTQPGHHLVHAGAVGRDHGAILLAGAAGAGKTTTALAALTHGLHYLADDYILLHTHPDPTAHSIYNTAKLDGGHLRRFPALASLVRFPPPEAADEKAVLDVASVRAGAPRQSLPVRAVVVPRISGVTKRARLRPTRSSDALLALAPSTVFQMPFDDRAVLGSLARLVREVPSYTLELGEDPAQLAEMLEQTLEQATR